MADTFGDVTGDLNDRIRIRLAGNDIPILESYEVEQSILTQPSRISARIGWGGVTKHLLEVLIPGIKMEVLIGDTPRFTGFLDGWEASDDPGATEITLHGRDNLAPLHDAFIQAEVAYKNLSYLDFVDLALDQTVGEHNLFATNNANRKLISGIGTQVTANPENNADQANKGPVARTLQAHLGERWYEYVKRELDRAGLFLWAAGDGSFILSEPNGNQAPSYRIARRRGTTRNFVNVERASYRNDTSGRYSECTVYGRGGGKKFGRVKATGSFVDQEMAGFLKAAGLKPRPLVLRDTNVTNNEQAVFYARRKIAETRRAGWSLTYLVSGHTIPSLQGGNRAVWTPDTVVQIQDDEYGLYGNYYLEKCVFRRNPQTTTELTLMRPEDLVFATGEQGP